MVTQPRSLAFVSMYCQLCDLSLSCLSTTVHGRPNPLGLYSPNLFVHQNVNFIECCADACPLCLTLTIQYVSMNEVFHDEDQLESQKLGILNIIAGLKTLILWMP